MTGLHIWRFEEVKRPARKQLKCRVCGVRFRRMRTFTQTVNPGNVKTPGEIWRELGERAEAWQPDDICTRCGEES